MMLTQLATPIGGGSVPGGMDHLVAAMVMEAAGEMRLRKLHSIRRRWHSDGRIAVW